MVTENLEQTQLQEELAAGVPDEELTGQVSTGEKVVPAALTFTEEQVTKRLSDAEKVLQSNLGKGFEKERQTFQAKIRELESQSAEINLKATEQHERELWGDTEEVREFQTERRKHSEERDQFLLQKAQTEALAQAVQLTSKTLKAKEYAKLYGVDEKELLETETPEQMEYKALKISHQILSSKLKEKEVTPQRVDSGVTSVAGVSFDKMTSDEKINWGLKHGK